MTVELTDGGISREEVVAVARRGEEVRVGGSAVAAMERGAAVVAELVASEEPVYGVSTGFGALATTRDPGGEAGELQKALIRSHAAGMGPEVETEVVRAMMVLRARSLSMGYRGVRPQVAEGIVELLNAGVTPVVPEYGSLGRQRRPRAARPLRRWRCSARGGARTADGELRAAAEALAAAGLEPLELGAKEGLALINGTDGILGMLVLALADLESLLKAADIAAALSVEALLGTDRAFAADLVALRPQPGQRPAPPTCARCWPARRSSPATATATRASRTPTRCAARRR